MWVFSLMALCWVILGFACISGGIEILAYGCDIYLDTHDDLSWPMVLAIELLPMWAFLTVMFLTGIFVVLIMLHLYSQITKRKSDNGANGADGIK